MNELTPITEIEIAIIAKLSKASFPPATASKRFIRALSSGHVAELSGRGRRFLAFIAHRFRRQYVLNEDEARWVCEWKNWNAPEESLPESLRKLICKDMVQNAV